MINEVDSRSSREWQDGWCFNLAQPPFNKGGNEGGFLNDELSLKDFSLRSKWQALPSPLGRGVGGEGCINDALPSPIGRGAESEGNLGMRSQRVCPGAEGLGGEGCINH